MAEAGELRDRGHGRLISYSRKVFIPLTHLCRDVCHYCTFAERPRAGQPAYLSPERGARHRPRRRGGRLHRGAVHPRRQAGAALPARRARRWRRSATRPRSTTSTAMCALVLRETGLLPHVNPGVMTREEIARPARGDGQPGHHAGDRPASGCARRAARTTARPTSIRPCGWRPSGSPAS